MPCLTRPRAPAAGRRAADRPAASRSEAVAEADRGRDAALVDGEVLGLVAAVGDIPMDVGGSVRAVIGDREMGLEIVVARGVDEPQAAADLAIAAMRRLLEGGLGVVGI